MMMKNCRINCLNRQNFFFFFSEELIHFTDEFIRQFLNVVLGATLVVFRTGLVFQQFFQGFIGVATDIADRNFGVLALGLDQLDHFLAALLGQRRRRHAYHLALGRWVQSQVGIAYRFFYRRDHLL